MLVLPWCWGGYVVAWGWDGYVVVVTFAPPRDPGGRPPNPNLLFYHKGTHPKFWAKKRKDNFPKKCGWKKKLPLLNIKTQYLGLFFGTCCYEKNMKFASGWLNCCWVQNNMHSKALSKYEYWTCCRWTVPRAPSLLVPFVCSEDRMGRSSISVQWLINTIQ